MVVPHIPRNVRPAVALLKERFNIYVKDNVRVLIEVSSLTGFLGNHGNDEIPGPFIYCENVYRSVPVTKSDISSVIKMLEGAFKDVHPPSVNKKSNRDLGICTHRY